MQRCAWARDDLSIAYHDKEWGVPLHDDRALFEFLILEGAQAGLSWSTILKKRFAALGKVWMITINSINLRRPYSRRYDMGLWKYSARR